MNKRLEKITSYISDGVGVIDVGTDHGYLPLELCRKNYKGNIIAADINEDPLSKAVHAAEQAGQSSRIQFILCDGLQQCDPDSVDTIVIAGMGGDTICGILDRAEWCMDSKYLLLLQPMTKAEVLRYWLVYNEFEILSESMVKENGSIYQILSARFGGTTKLNDAELFCGKREMQSSIELYDENIELLKHRFQRAHEGLVHADTIGLEGRLRLTEKILEQLEVL